jgi:hypothetical protein
MWALSAAYCGVDISEFPVVKEWRDTLEQRPKVQRGLQVPMPYLFSDAMVNDPENSELFEKIGRHEVKDVQREIEKWPKPIKKGFKNVI